MSVLKLKAEAKQSSIAYYVGLSAWILAGLISLRMLLFDCGECQSSITGVPSQFRSVLTMLGLAYSCAGCGLWISRSSAWQHALLLLGAVTLGGLLAVRVSSNWDFCPFCIWFWGTQVVLWGLAALETALSARLLLLGVILSATLGALPVANSDFAAVVRSMVPRSEKLPPCTQFVGRRVANKEVASGQYLLVSKCTPCVQARIERYMRAHEKEPLTVIHAPNSVTDLKLPPNWKKVAAQGLEDVFPETSSQKGAWLLTLEEGKVTKCSAIK
jgi:hypothetical protein